MNLLITTHNSSNPNTFKIHETHKHSKSIKPTAKDDNPIKTKTHETHNCPNAQIHHHLVQPTIFSDTRVLASKRTIPLGRRRDLGRFQWRCTRFDQFPGGPVRDLKQWSPGAKDGVVQIPFALSRSCEEERVSSLMRRKESLLFTEIEF
jgi:hypothetical protein